MTLSYISLRRDLGFYSSCDSALPTASCCSLSGSLIPSSTLEFLTVFWRLGTWEKYYFNVITIAPVLSLYCVLFWFFHFSLLFLYSHPSHFSAVITFHSPNNFCLTIFYLISYCKPYLVGFLMSLLLHCTMFQILLSKPVLVMYLLPPNSVKIMIID